MELKSYLNDGANCQAQAVLCMLRNFNIRESWNEERKEYSASPEVARWENCREQGYVVSMKSKGYKRQLNIIFFEHRNSDSICAVKWEQTTLNPPTINTAEFGDIYKDKYDVSFEVGYGEITKMAAWIEEQLTTFWIESAKETITKK